MPGASGETKYFCKGGLASHFGKHEVICPSGKSVESVQQFTSIFAQVLRSGVVARFVPSRREIKRYLRIRFRCRSPGKSDLDRSG